MAVQRIEGMVVPYKTTFIKMRVKKNYLGFCFRKGVALQGMQRHQSHLLPACNVSKILLQATV
jgi:hypothetical protein